MFKLILHNIGYYRWYDSIFRKKILKQPMWIEQREIIWLLEVGRLIWSVFKLDCVMNIVDKIQTIVKVQIKNSAELKYYRTAIKVVNNGNSFPLIYIVPKNMFTALLLMGCYHPYGVVRGINSVVFSKGVIKFDKFTDRFLFLKKGQDETDENNWREINFVSLYDEKAV